MHPEYVIDVLGAVTLVECTVRNDREVPVEMTVSSRLDGPTWPPRRFGRAAQGWHRSDDGWRFEATVGAGDLIGIGFASPGDPRSPPIDVSTVPAAETGSGVESSTDILAEYGDPRPSRAAIRRPRADRGRK